MSKRQVQFAMLVALIVAVFVIAERKSGPALSGIRTPPGVGPVKPTMITCRDEALLEPPARSDDSMRVTAESGTGEAPACAAPELGGVSSERAFELAQLFRRDLQLNASSLRDLAMPGGRNATSHQQATPLSEEFSKAIHIMAEERQRRIIQPSAVEALVEQALGPR